jgi:hypothetical protein
MSNIHGFNSLNNNNNNNGGGGAGGAGGAGGGINRQMAADQGVDLENVPLISKEITKPQREFL